MSYLENREWSDRFVPELKRIVGPMFLEVAPIELDQKENTDLIVFKFKPELVSTRIACRVRRHEYYFVKRYRREFTIRSRLESGNETELSKVMNGFGDWLVYGFEREPGQIDIHPWRVIDLASFRFWFRKCGYPNPEPSKNYGERDNGDGSWFYWFNVEAIHESMPSIIRDSSVWRHNERRRLEA